MIAAVFAAALLAMPAPDVPAPAGTPPEAGAVAVPTFDLLCNRMFPDDARLDAAMGALAGARALTPAEVRVYLKNDPGRGWELPTAGPARLIVTVEAPPYRACAVRLTHSDGRIDAAAWQRIVDAAQARGGFVPVPVRSATFGTVRSQIEGIQKQRPDGGAEAFYLFRTTPVDPARSPAAGVEIRLVHQLVVPPAR